MKEKHWKPLAIIFIILFGLLLIYNIWAVTSFMKEVASDEEKDNFCDRSICLDYYYGFYLDGVCYCYNENDEQVKSEYMG